MNLEISNNESITLKNYLGKDVYLFVDIFKEKVEAMLIGGAIGDALGVPVEMKSKETILKNFGEVREYIASKNNKFFNKGGLLTEESGLISDDTLLTFAGVNSFIDKQCFDLKSIFNESIKSYKSFPYGFGGATTKAINELESGKDVNELSNTESAGNGVVMKQAPYAAYSLVSEFNDIDENILKLTQSTHGHKVSLVASLVHNRFLMELLTSDYDLDLGNLLKYLLDYSKDLEEKFYSDEDLNIDRISILLKLLLEDYNNGGLDDNSILEKYGWGEKNIHSSGYVYITLGIVYSIFLSGKKDFESLLRTVNIGGDVDTFASIIGNMIGAYSGKFYDNKYLEGLEKKDELIEKSEAFNNFLIKKKYKYDSK